MPIDGIETEMNISYYTGKYVSNQKAGFHKEISEI